MITEEAVPLQVSLEDSDSGKSDYAISWGIHQTLVSDNTLVSYTGNFGTGKIGESWAIRQNFPRQYSQLAYGICTDCCIFTKFFFANSFYLHGSPNISPAKYFPCTVFEACWYVYVY